ncbi:MAG: PLP-dependent aspartate aminotransferase family protein [Myxococcota bacterium]|nr:PLP-dependent aspartate aminotransferase family protein [Myxococcota bacterium]
MSWDTLAVHAGRADLKSLGVHAPPLDLSTTYPVPDRAEGTASLEALAMGEAKADNPVYARLHNPTVARFEEGLAALEGADAAVAFASGMAAITAMLMAFSQKGKHLVAVRPLYGGTDHLLNAGLLGMEVSWVRPDQVREAIRPDTALVLVETPANPTLALVDIRDVVAQAGEVPVCVDSTFATPVLQRPMELGAALVVHSATKFLGGHGDVLAGVVACSEEHAALLRQIRVITGAVLHPLAGYLLHRGLQTLAVRVRQAQQNAQALAERLAGHPMVQAVRYPGLPGQDPRGLIGTHPGAQMRGPGAILAFELQSLAHADQVMRRVRLLTPAVSLGSTDSLIQHPAGLTHRVIGEEAQAEGGITAGMMRISVGLEDPEDLWRDLVQAIEGERLAAAK